jgi:hypothetical protein
MTVLPVAHIADALMPALVVVVRLAYLWRELVHKAGW